MVKKTIAAACAALMLAALLAGCGTSSTGLAEKGLELALSMDELASLEQYAGSMSASGGVTGLVQKMGEGDYSSPKAIYAIALDDAAAQDILMEGADIPARLKPWMMGRIYASVPSQLTAYSGVEFLAAAGVVAYDECFVFAGLNAPALYLYQYEGEYSVMVSFRPGQDGAVKAAAQFIPADDALKTASGPDDIAAWLAGRLSFEGITVESLELAGR